MQKDRAYPGLLLIMQLNDADVSTRSLHRGRGSSPEGGFGPRSSFPTCPDPGGGRKRGA